MANTNTTIMATAILVALVFTAVPCLAAQSPRGSPMMSPTSPTTMGPAPDCMTALYNVSDCLSFVQVGSNMTAPDKACCPEFAGLLESNPICLCDLIGSSESFGVDLSRALMLPDACKLETPSISSCPATPTSAPEPSPTGEAPGSTAAGAVPNGGAAPGPVGSGTGGSNGASSTTVHDLSTFVCLAVAIFIAYYF
ncbi:non-specific lipid-transfer protein-like protein At5g64080 [Cynara cardunculus var. scolymus]|nr:non-specific lipid-transfer protein-like protein At5g64080 [Cynara cardunculus var. scolymus]